MGRSYICIDLKSFYASVECVDRGLDPMKENLVVADAERSKNTICLAITPAMKALGIKNRCRLGEIPPEVDFFIASPRMKKYIQYSADIYSIYLSFFAKEDIQVYSIDEAFIDVTNYMKLYGRSPREIGKMVMDEIFRQTGIRATCGVGTNLYLAKIALDILAKHSTDFIGELDESSFRERLWEHKPLTDFWRIGEGTAKRLNQNGIYTMRDITLASENMLYGIFGIDAELLIDHAYGRESTTIADIKAYKPKSACLSSSQVLMRDYSTVEALTVIKEMADLMCLEMTAKELVTRSVTIYIGYSMAYGDHASRGTFKLPVPTNSSEKIVAMTQRLYKSIALDEFPVRRLAVSCNELEREGEKQLSLFEPETDKSHKIQKTVNEIRYKYGKNAIIKAMDLKKEATAVMRNNQIGGHRSG